MISQEIKYFLMPATTNIEVAVAQLVNVMLSVVTPKAVKNVVYRKFHFLLEHLKFYSESWVFEV